VSAPTPSSPTVWERSHPVDAPFEEFSEERSENGEEQDSDDPDSNQQHGDDGGDGQVEGTRSEVAAQGDEPEGDHRHEPDQRGPLAGLFARGRSVGVEIPGRDAGEKQRPAVDVPREQIGREHRSLGECRRNRGEADQRRRP